MTTDRTKSLQRHYGMRSRGAGQSLARSHGILALAVVLCSPAELLAQYPTLAPTTNTTIVVPPGGLHYSAIAIPAGVTVSLALPYYPTSPPFLPAVILCDGDAIVHGVLSAGAFPYGIGYPAGLVTTGDGVAGVQCGGSLVCAPTSGVHAGSYGSVFPFSLEGGSSGGWLLIYTDPNCWQPQGLLPGGPGGGTIVLLADGRIEVGGSVTADGWYAASPGSGGSILLRGAAGVTVLPGGSVSARALADPSPDAQGYIRLDSWGSPPVIQGTIAPAPATVELPYLRTLIPPRIGTTWLAYAHAPQNTPVFVGASLLPGSGMPTPFGLLGLDLGTSASVAAVATTVGQHPHDPMASVAWPVPNLPVFIGLHLWVQGVAAPPGLPPRLTNTLAVVIG